MFPLHCSGLFRWIRTSVLGRGTGWCSVHAGCYLSFSPAPQPLNAQDDTSACSQVPGPCPLLSGREPWFTREADSDEGDSHMQLHTPWGDTPLCLEWPPCPHSELLLVFQVPAQKCIFFKQLPAPPAGRWMARCVLNANHALKKN